MIQPYNPFRPLFYPTVLGVLFGTMYFIYKANPSLPDQLALVEKQKNSDRIEGYLVRSTDLKPESDISQFSPTNPDGIDVGDSGSYPEDLRIDFRFEPNPENLETVTVENSLWSVDDHGLVVPSSKGFKTFDNSGNPLWSFSLKDQVLPTGPLPLAKDHLFFATEMGDIVCLQRTTGSVVWIKRFGKEIVKQPVLVAGHLVVLFAEPDDTWMIVRLAAQDGNEVSRLGKINKPSHNTLAFSADRNLMPVLSQGGRVRVYDLKKAQPIWSNSFPNSFEASPVIHKDRLYISATEGVLFATDISSGRLIWEVDLKGRLQSPMTLLPQTMIGVVADKENYLHVIDLRNGKRKWRYNLKTEAKNFRFTGVRMNASAQSRLNMSPESQGWAFWGPCNERNLCAFDPFKGYILKQLELPGPLTGHAHFFNQGTEILQTYLEGKTLKFRKFTEKQRLEKTPVDNQPPPQ